MLAGVFAATSLVVAAPARAAGTPLPSNAVLVTEGHGWGHGRGMGQWGAKGQADAGKTWSQIVLSYYSGVTIGDRPADEDIRVLVETSAEVLVSSDSPFTVKWIGAGTLAASDGTFKFFRARHDGTNYIIEKSPAHTGPWTVVGTNTIPARFVPGSSLIQHIENTGIVRYYRGSMDAIRTGTTSMRSINVLTMTEYLYGAVPREMPATWAPEAVKSQAVAARSYATYKRDSARAAGQNYDICATTSCQVYLGVAYRTSVGSSTVTQLEHSASNSAVGLTAGKVLFSSGKPILAEYSSSTGGYTAAGSVSYLSPVPDPWDSISPHHDWSTEVSANAIEAEWPEIGQLVGANVTKRNGYGEWGGRVLEMQLVGTTKTLTISGDAFRSAFSWPSSGGVKSNWFRIATFQGVLAATPAKIAVVAGSYATLPILMKNTGTAAWPLGGAVRLATPAESLFAGPGWISPTRPAAVTSNASVPGKTYIGVGEVGRFNVQLNAFVLAPGKYTEQLQLVNDDLGTSMSAWFTIEVSVIPAIAGVVRGSTWYLLTGGAGSSFTFGGSGDRKLAGDWDGDGDDTPGVVSGNTWKLNNGFDSTAEKTFGFGSSTDRPITGDWDGDGIDTPGVVRGNTWYLATKPDNVVDLVFSFGSASDRPIAGDFDGDGIDTPGVVRGSTWYLASKPDRIVDITFTYGLSTDVPLVGDWDGDGDETPGAFRGNLWLVSNAFDSTADMTFAHGSSGDIPIVGDWNGPAPVTPALVDGNVWKVNTGFDPTAEAEFGFGVASDVPVAGDWDGDGVETPGVYRDGTWYLASDPDRVVDIVVEFGSSGDVPVVGDWDGDGDETPGLVSGSTWKLINGFDGTAEKTFSFGTTGDRPIVGDWNGDGTDTPGVVRENTWYLATGTDYEVDLQFAFGSASDTPVAGDFDGDGIDTPGVFRVGTWYLASDPDRVVDIVFSYGDGSERPIMGRWTA